MILNPQTPGIYIGKFPLSQFQVPQSILFSGSSISLSKTYSKCFDLGLDDLGFLQPSLTYVLSTDPCYQSIIAAASLSRRLDEIPPMYHRRGNTFYLFNVCTHPYYRGRGYMKELLTRARQDLLTYPRPPDTPFRQSRLNSREWYNPSEPTWIYLLVHHDNSPAINLYSNLGFEIQGMVNKATGPHYIMSWSQPNLGGTPRSEGD
jgi:ribosomal protein S18 acetylase RimI-like enzyme